LITGLPVNNLTKEQRDSLSKVLPTVQPINATNATPTITVDPAPEISQRGGDNGITGNPRAIQL
jgi:hypothetical protein